MLDLTKPVQTRDGQKVRILCTDRKYTAGLGGPVVGLIMRPEGIEEYRSWCLDGKVTSGWSDKYDLVQAPVVHKYSLVWWAEDGGAVYPTAYILPSGYKVGDTHAVVGDARRTKKVIKVEEISYTEGQ